METASYIDKLAFTAGQENQMENYWLNQLPKEPQKSVFPYPHKRIDANKRLMKEYSFKLADDYYSQLMKLSNGSLLRLHMLAIAGIVSLLFKYCGHNDIIVGTSIYRQEMELQGEFINTVLALRHRLQGNTTFKELVLQVRSNITGAVENQNFPIELVLEKLGIPLGKDDDFPLFDIAVLLENIQDRTYLQHINHNMSFFFSETGESVDAVVEYNSSLYQEENIQRVITHFKNLLRQVLFNFDLELAHIDILTREEKRLLLIEFNHTDTAYPEGLTITELFQQQAEKTPHHTAVIHENHQVTYNRLNRRSNQLAWRLREKGVKPDSIVGLMPTPSLSPVMGILAILKAGAAFLPLDPENPESRIRFILKDSSTRVIILSKRLINEKIKTLPHISPGHIISLDDDSSYSDREEAVRHDIDSLPHPKHMAYIIYTSGTTGSPKGVIIDHQGLVNYIWWAAHRYVKNERVNFPLFTSISFDLTITSIFTPLITGNAIVVYGNGDGDKTLLIKKVIDESRVGVVKLTPSHLRLVRENPIQSSAVKRYIVGGEELDTQLAADISGNSHHDIEIYNEYGPTEAVVGCMCHRFNPETDTRLSVPIGLPINNMQIFILDANGCAVPPGAVGEMYISGHGVARGYLNQPELTHEKFDHDLCDSPGYQDGNNRSYKSYGAGKLYQTGDLARWLADGNIEFLGRIDHQVKIRGYRIELGEIQNQILKNDDVKDAVVIVREDKGPDKYLCAYLIPAAPGDSFNVTGLKQYLSNTLPDFMIPQYFVIVDNIPLTSNGKVDQKALPAPELKQLKKYVAPSDKTEETLTRLWADCLGIKQELIGVYSNFFDLGGHSLSAAVLVSKLQKTFNVKAPMAKVFEMQTIAEFAQYIKNAKKEIFVSVQPGEKCEYYRLSSAQRRLYIMQQMGISFAAYNVPNLWRIEGKLNTQRLEQAFRELIKRHESMRTSFETIEEEPAQKIHQNVKFEIEYYSPGKEETTGHTSLSPQSAASSQQLIANLVEKFIQPFDLSRPPLIRVGLIQLEEKKHILMVDMHHIITDGVSHNILIGDFAVFYDGKDLPGLRLQYKDFSQWQNSEAMKQSISHQKAYWLDQFSGNISPLNLPADYKRRETKTFAGDHVNISIGKELSHRVKELARETETTLFMVLLAAYNILLSRYSQQEDIVVGSPITGRRHADLQYIVGMFVNMLAFRNRPTGNKTFGAFLAEVKQNALQCYENQDCQFEQLIVDLGLQGAGSRNPLFDVVFAMQKIDIDTREYTAGDFKGIEHLKFAPYPFKKSTTPFDLLMAVFEGEETTAFTLTYSTELFKPSTAQIITQHYIEILEQVTANKDLELQDIQLSHQMVKLESQVILGDEGEFGF
ncbi:MAG: amino acid adenylation domain-containing protein [Candidatus Aminicenantes bacterium]|jgi:amino acid adenylation domain-containing protein